jgi:hypothetical protein
VSGRTARAGSPLGRLRGAVARRLGRERPAGPVLRADDPVPAAEAQRRIEAARERLRATIPPPADEDD